MQMPCTGHRDLHLGKQVESNVAHVKAFTTLAAKWLTLLNSGHSRIHLTGAPATVVMGDCNDLPRAAMTKAL